MRYARSWIIAIPLAADTLAAGSYTLRLTTATSNGSTPLVDATGGAPSIALTILAPPSGIETFRPYATPDQLTDLLSVFPSENQPCTEAEIQFAQGIIDGWLKRSLWPTIYEREPHRIEPSRAWFKCGVVPLLRVISLEGRWAYSRRDTRQIPIAAYGLPAVLTVLGPQKWSVIDVTSVQTFDSTGEIWLPQNLVLPYNQVAATYEAGFTSMSHEVFEALAEIISVVRMRGFAPLVGYGEGRINRQYKSEEFITEPVKQKLGKWQVRSWV